MTSEHAQHIRKEIATNGITNALFNGVVAWFLLRGGNDLDLYQNVVGDVLATTFILSFIVGMIVISINRGKVRRNDIGSLTLQRSGIQSLLRKMPTRTWLAALYFAAATTVFIGGATVFVLIIIGAGPFTPFEYAVFKGVWAGLLAAIIAYPLIVFGLAVENLETRK